MSDTKQIVDAKLARIKAAVSLEAHDRVPVVANGDYWPVPFSRKYTMQEAFYSIDVAAECYNMAFSEWSKWDAFAPILHSLGPVLDATGSRRYKVPGRDLPAHAEFQHPDLTLMTPEEYPQLIDDPFKFQMEVIIPRLCARIGSDDLLVRAKAYAKAALYYLQLGQKARAYGEFWKNEYGVPPLYQGQSIYVPIDWLADKLRGFHHGLLDIKERPSDVQAACEALIPFIVKAALTLAPGGQDYPLIFNPQHVSPFISPKDYQKVYWPTFKKIVDEVTGRGYRMWVLLENNQEHHLECLQELPKGKVVAHLESTDLAKAKKALGGKLCLAGGMPSILLARGTPEEVRERTISVLRLFEDEPGFIMTASTAVPSNAKPENIHAWLNAVEEFGQFSGTRPAAAEASPGSNGRGKMAEVPREPSSSWDAFRSELGDIPGDEGIIREKWEELEGLLFPFVSWLVR